MLTCFWHFGRHVFPPAPPAHTHLTSAAQPPPRPTVLFRWGRVVTVELDAERALLANIWANPEDDLSRLVYADWLDDHGDDRRAELIRLQCSVSRRHRDGLPPDRLNEERMQELVTELVRTGGIRELDQPLSDSFRNRRGCTLSFRRGLIEDMIVPTDPPIRGLPESLIVQGSLGLSGTAVTSIPSSLRVGDTLNLCDTPLTTLPVGLSVPGNLHLRGSTITELPEGLNVGGDLDFFDTAITQLPARVEVGGNVIAGVGLRALPRDLRVGGIVVFNHAARVNECAARDLVHTPGLSDYAKREALRQTGHFHLAQQIGRPPSDGPRRV